MERAVDEERPGEGVLDRGRRIVRAVRQVLADLALGDLQPRRVGDRGEIGSGHRPHDLRGMVGGNQRGDRYAVGIGAHAQPPASALDQSAERRPGDRGRGGDGRRG